MRLKHLRAPFADHRYCNKRHANTARNSWLEPKGDRLLAWASLSNPTLLLVKSLGQTIAIHLLISHAL